MSKDKRYKMLKKLIDGGYVTQFSEILEIIPKTVLAHELGMHHQTFEKLIKDPRRFTYQQTLDIAALIDVDAWALAKLIYDQILINKNAKKKKIV